MKHVSLRKATLLAAVATSALLLAGCNMMDRLSSVGETPKLSKIENPVQERDYEPVTLPMPKPDLARYQPNSLWRTGAKAFFKDQRAANIGDILTINIQIADKADLENTTERTRTTTEKDSVPSMLGYEATLGKLPVLAAAADPSSLIGIDGSTLNKGSGTIQRKEAIELKVAGLVTQILPNGNLVIHGRQEMRVNYEVRELFITGIVRPQDISALNTVSYDKIAEARVAYGGRGIINDVQQPRYGTQVLDILYPF